MLKCYIIMSTCDIIHIHVSHGFEGDIPGYKPRGDTKALARYVTRCRSPDGYKQT